MNGAVSERSWSRATVSHYDVEATLRPIQPLETTCNRVAFLPSAEGHRKIPWRSAPETIQLRVIVETTGLHCSCNLSVGFGRDAPKKRDVAATDHYAVIEAQDSAPRGPGNDVGPYSIETFHPFASRLSPIPPGSTPSQL